MKKLNLDIHQVVKIYITLFFSLYFFGLNALTAEAKRNQLVKERLIVKEAKRFLENTLIWDSDHLEMEIFYSGGNLVIPKGVVELEYKMPGRKNRAGRVPLILNVRLNGLVKKRVRMYAEVIVIYDVLTARRGLRRNQILTERDVEWTEVRSKHVLRNVVTDLNEVIGSKITRNLDPGENLSPYMLKKVPLVKRGDRVTLIAIKGALKITVPGVAKENGFKDATVMVQNVQSKKIVYGTVVNSRTVMVNY